MESDPEIDPPSFVQEDDNYGLDINSIKENYNKNLVRNLESGKAYRDNNDNKDNKNRTLITNIETQVKKISVKPSIETNFIKQNKKIEVPVKNKFIKPSSNINLIDKFEKNFNKGNFEYNYDKMNDSDYRDDIVNEDLDKFTDKNEVIKRYMVIKDKLKEKTFQVEALQECLEEIKKSNSQFMDIISNDGKTELKDKKLIEFAKKNTDLKIKLEKYKLIEKELQNRINELNNKIDTSKKSLKQENLSMLVIPSNLNNYSNDEENKKKLKQSESKIVDMRNKLQMSKEENTKLNILIKREVGEAIDIDKALKDKVYWKGRSEIIESLKTKIKILEAQRESLSANLDNSTLNSEDKKSNLNLGLNNSNVRTPVPNTNFVSYSEYKKEKEALKSEIEKLKEENAKYATENSKVKLRISSLEKDLRSQKEDLTSKIKILIEKSDNDEKLILALNRELEKRGNKSISPLQLGYENPVFNLQQEINKLRNEIKEKDTYILHLNNIMLPEGSNQGNNDSQWNTQTLNRIITRLKEVEDENKLLKLQTDDGKIYETLARENAKLRLKVKDLEDKISI